MQLAQLFQTGNQLWWFFLRFPGFGGHGINNHQRHSRAQATSSTEQSVRNGTSGALSISNHNEAVIGK